MATSKDPRRGRSSANRLHQSDPGVLSRPYAACLRIRFKSGRQAPEIEWIDRSAEHLPPQSTRTSPPAPPCPRGCRRARSASPLPTSSRRTRSCVTSDESPVAPGRVHPRERAPPTQQMTLGTRMEVGPHPRRRAALGISGRRPRRGHGIPAGAAVA